MGKSSNSAHRRNDGTSSRTEQRIPLHPKGAHLLARIAADDDEAMRIYSHEAFLICQRCYIGSKRPEVIDPETLTCVDTPACMARANERWIREANKEVITMADSAKALAAPKDLRPLIQAALRQGWTIEAQSEHDVFVDPAGNKVSSIPRHRNGTDYRLFKNVRADLVKAGLHLTGRPPKGVTVEHPLHPERKTPPPVLGVQPEPKVSSHTDGPLVPGSTRPLHQNERPVPITPPPPTFPRLDTLLAIAAKAKDVEQASELMTKAAELLGKDTTSHDNLMAEAVGLLDTVKLSDVEQEYLTYAKHYPRIRKES